MKVGISRQRGNWELRGFGKDHLGEKRKQDEKMKGKIWQKMENGGEGREWQKKMKRGKDGKMKK